MSRIITRALVLVGALCTMAGTIIKVVTDDRMMDEKVEDRWNNFMKEQENEVD